MSENLFASLTITLVGIIIVFSALALVWVMMVVLTKLGSTKQPVEANELEGKRKAAAIAAVFAFNLAKGTQKSSYHLPPTAIVSAWQLSMRARQLKEGIKVNERR